MHQSINQSKSVGTSALLKHDERGDDDDDDDDDECGGDDERKVRTSIYLFDAMRRDGYRLDWMRCDYSDATFVCVAPFAETIRNILCDGWMMIFVVCVRTSIYLYSHRCDATYGYDWVDEITATRHSYAWCLLRRRFVIFSVTDG